MHFGIDDVRSAKLAMRVDGPEGFMLDGESSMAMISRDPLDLVAQAIGANHQYPDGFVLFLGTMFAPTKDRHAPGQGFTHVVGDIVTVSTPTLGALVNRVERSDRIAPWTFGAGALDAQPCAARAAAQGSAPLLERDDFLLLLAQAVDAERHHVAGLAATAAASCPSADAGRRAGRDHVARQQRHVARHVGHELRDAEDHRPRVAASAGARR